MEETTLNQPESNQPGGAPQTGVWGAIARYFDFDFYRVTYRGEVIAGITTFMTMAYILVVNPLILSDAIFVNEAGDLFPQLVTATAVAAAIGTALMAVLAKYPFAMAPGMGMNAYFAYSVVLGLGVDWRVALAAVLVEGIIFILLTVTDVRRHLITAVPDSIKFATTVGIGLFLAYIGLSGAVETGGAGIIVANEATKTGIGSFAQPQSLLAIFGIFLTSLLLVRRVKGALLWGILGTAILGWAFGVASPPQGIVAVPVFPSTLFGQAFLGLASIANWLDFAVIVLVFLFVDIFDTIGTLSAVGNQGGYINTKGELPRANEALFSDAIATTAGAIVGTSTTTTYIESAAGIGEGGRTGFTALVVAALFVLALLFAPVFQAIPAFATAPALVIVGVFMMKSVLKVNWNDMAEAIPAFLTIFLIPLGYSIAAGLSAGIITYPIVKAFQGRASDVPIATWVLAAIFLARYLFITSQVG
ncbi:NCS2 family permease [Leptolyngbya sp. AN02str]|uniref:NCS2 family permease n=1 Tax=Leptolyngbya sp. AN02str TaxID=3423363 RepID=UPI003D31FD3D